MHVLSRRIVVDCKAKSGIALSFLLTLIEAVAVAVAVVAVVDVAVVAADSGKNKYVYCWYGQIEMHLVDSPAFVVDVELVVKTAKNSPF